MKRVLIQISLLILSCVLLYSKGFCIGADEIVRLKNSGMDDETIRIIIDEKIIETCAFTVDELVDMKKAGLANGAIQDILKSASFMKDAGPIDYGEDIKRIRSITVKDIIALKNAGISDDVIKAVLSGTGDRGDEDTEMAWRMLEKMGIIVDERQPPRR